VDKPRVDVTPETRAAREASPRRRSCRLGARRSLRIAIAPATASRRSPPRPPRASLTSPLLPSKLPRSSPRSTQSAAFAHTRVATTAKASKATRRVSTIVHASATEGANATRRQAVLSTAALSASLLTNAKPAHALSGFSVVKDTRDGYQFYYPVGWQEISVDGQDAVYKDVIEPLESVALNIYPTQRESLTDIGSPDEVANTLVGKALAVPGAQAKVLKTAQRKDKDGHLYYFLEYVTKSNQYERHALTIVTITQGKFYTLTTGSSERRWPKMKDRLQTVIDSFNVYY
jgi:photosystem II oxygen-evolving enhancer protein 2|tara:strand:+ start:69 stop:935 length:867 start_codon:yes stop_codon:yes gene_type:complete